MRAICRLGDRDFGERSLLRDRSRPVQACLGLAVSARRVERMVRRAIVGATLLLAACSGSAGRSSPSRGDAGLDAGPPTPATKYSYPTMTAGP